MKGPHIILILIVFLTGCGGLDYSSQLIEKHLCMDLPDDPEIISSDYQQDELFGDLGYEQTYVLDFSEEAEMQNLIRQIQANRCENAKEGSTCGCWNQEGQFFVHKPYIDLHGDEIVVEATFDPETKLLDLKEIRW